MVEHVSPDGQLRFRVLTHDDSDVSLGFAGFPWHTHADILAATTGLPETEAVFRFVNDLLNGVSVIVLWSVGDELRDVWGADDPASDAAYPQWGETVSLRYWNGRPWQAHPRTSSAS